MSLVRWLEEQQAGTSNEKFATMLGITPEYWGLIRRGKRRLTLMVLRKTIERFPQHREEILRRALASESDQGQQKVAVCTRYRPMLRGFVSETN